MKTIIKATLCALCLPLLALAQPPNRQPEDAARDFIKQYHAGKIEGLQITVFLQQENGLLTPVDPQREFKQGERVKIVIESNFRGYAYVVNIGSSGKKQLIFPDGKESNLLQPRRRYTLPRTYDLIFDEREGFETLQVFVARQRIQFLDAALKQPEGEMNEAQALAAASLWSDRAPRQAGVVVNDIVANRDPQSAADSDGQRDPVWDRRKKATIVAIPRRKEPGGKTPDNRIAAFGIKLKNAGARR